MAKVKVYDMVMEFELTVGLKSVNRFINEMGFDGKTCVTGPVLTVTQTLPIIPDTEYIKKIEDAVKKHYAESESDIDVVDCKFKGYKKFLEREVDIKE